MALAHPAGLVLDETTRQRTRDLLHQQGCAVVHDRSHFVAALRAAVLDRTPFACGKLGISEKHWMFYPEFLASEPPAQKRVVYDHLLHHHSYDMEGVFPPDTSFYLKFNDFFLEYVRDMDYLGLVLEPVMDPAIVRRYGLRNRVVFYKELLPEKWAAAQGPDCYLDVFRDRRLLLVCPFASLLQERANKETFERTWAKPGIPWFHPADVQALEIPFGTAHDTHRRFRSVLDLFEFIQLKLAACEFDVALIAAGGLAVPIAALAKRMGKVGIQLGGNLQILFGVAGGRWRTQPRWQDLYINDSWIDMPERFRPSGAKPDRLYF